MKTMKQNERESKDRGWKSGTGGWQRLAAPMRTSENREGFYRCLGSGSAGSQARLPGSQHRRRTTQGPSANKQTKPHRGSRQVLPPMSFGVNQEKHIWFSE